MSYTYLQGQGEESSAECFSDIPVYALSRLNLTAGKSCCKGSATESCRSSQSGTMCEPLTASRGEGKLTSSAADSHAKTSVQPEKARVSKASEADCEWCDKNSYKCKRSGAFVEKWIFCTYYHGNGITPEQEIEELKMKNEKLRARIKHLEEVEDAYNELAMEEDWEDER